MNGKWLLNSIVAGTFLSWILAVPASAQPIANNESVTAAPGTQGAELSEVTVTARRVAENLQTVPISITALSADLIREQNITDPFDLNTTVPGLTVAPTSLDRGSEIFTIRGQGQILGGPEPAVASYFNDVPTVVTSQGFFFDLANVEVLKGPQGTLFGINSTGGAILFVPQRPTNDFGGYVDATVGNYAERRYQAVVNIPVISDVLLVRFAMDANYRDGYTTNPVNGDQYDDVDYQAGRLGVTFTPSDWFTNYLLVNVATVNEHGAGNECMAYNPAGQFINGAGNLAAACAAQAAYGPRLVNMWTPPLGDYARVRNNAADDTMTFKLADGITLKDIFGYREYLYKQSYDNYGTPFPVFEYSLVPNWSAGLGVAQPSQKTFSDELQLHGDSFANRFHWQAGLFADTTSPYSDNDIDVATYYSVALVTFQSLNWKKTHAVYAQGTYDLTDKLNFTMGARYTEDLRRQLTTVANSNGSSDLSAKFHAPTWDLSLQYQADKDTMFYIASRRGYKSGGFNNVDLTAAQEFQPEHVTDVELGVKNEFNFAGGVKGRLNADVFYSQFIHWQERVTAIYPTVNGPLPFAVVTNVADGVVEGADIEATLIPTPHIEISGFYSYLNPFFTSNEVDGQNYVNSPMANMVKHKTSATVRYLFGLPDSIGDASVSATYSWQSTQTGGLTLATSPTPDPMHGLLPAYGLLNLRADWKSVFGTPLDVGAFVENATNKTYLTLMNNAWTLGEDVGEYGPPRMFGLEARWHFGHNNQ
jgi:iron complex outermembrane receptor protein